MEWSRTTRSGFEAALRRATVAVFEAQQYASDHGEEGAVVDLSSVSLTLESMRKASLEGRASGRVQPPLKGQTKIPEAASG